MLGVPAGLPERHEWKTFTYSGEFFPGVRIANGELNNPVLLKTVAPQVLWFSLSEARLPACFREDPHRHPRLQYDCTRIASHRIDFVERDLRQ